jgi:hypothetical protein
MDVLHSIFVGVLGALVIALAAYITIMAIGLISFIGNEIATLFGLEDSYCNLSLRDLVLGIIPVSIVIYILYLLGAFIVAYG